MKCKGKGRRAEVKGNGTLTSHSFARSRVASEHRLCRRVQFQDAPRLLQRQARRGRAQQQGRRHVRGGVEGGPEHRARRGGAWPRQVRDWGEKVAKYSLQRWCFKQSLSGTWTIKSKLSSSSQFRWTVPRGSPTGQVERLLHPLRKEDSFIWMLMKSQVTYYRKGK